MKEVWLSIEIVSDIENCSKRTMLRRIRSGHYKTVKYLTLENGGGKNGKQPQIALSCLPPSAQKRYAAKYGHAISPDHLPALSPEAALLTAKTKSSAWGDDTMSVHVIKDQRVARIAAIVQEATEVPAGFRKRAWIETVASRHNTSMQSIYRYIKRYKQAGLSGLQHKKSNKGTARSWSQEALDWWLGTVLKREHRKISKDALYKRMQIEAGKHGWRIGSYESALWWFHKKAAPQLQALQRGGHRALDNSLPPVLRDYSDLQPFEILVGDQHRFDFWVVDDDTGEVFRPEGYFWQDLRTRCFYGGAVAKKYDSYLIGLALRMGIRIFGPFKTIYTDNGKPELSRYIMGIMSDMRTLGMAVEQTVDLPYNHSIDDNEEITPLLTMPGTHRKAIVRNAKAKMIEGTFNVTEGIMRNRLMLPGYCKRLTDSSEEQDVDQKEAEQLAAAGKLPTFSEFTIRMYQALDFYNKDKHHRGVLKEWTWKPRPKHTTPMDCLMACHKDGWRPRKLSLNAVDIIFLPKAARIVDRGRILFNNNPYEHKTEKPEDNWLLALHKEKITLRYDPMDPEWLLVFHHGEFVCVATKVEYSSMKDQDLASRKIEEKRRLRKYFLEKYRKLTSAVPDIREYSQVPQVEKAGKQLTAHSSKLIAEERELSRVRTQAELSAEVTAIEAQSSKLKAQSRKVLPARPGYFISELARYEWCVNYEMAGGALKEKDTIFKAGYEAAMPEDQREYWQTVRALGGANA